MAAFVELKQAAAEARPRLRMPPMSISQQVAASELLSWKKSMFTPFDKVKQIYKKTWPDTQLPKLCAGGQRLYLRSLDHLGKSSEVKEKKS